MKFLQFDHKQNINDEERNGKIVFLIFKKKIGFLLFLKGKLVWIWIKEKKYLHNTYLVIAYMKARRLSYHHPFFVSEFLKTLL